MSGRNFLPVRLVIGNSSLPSFLRVIEVFLLDFLFGGLHISIDIHKKFTLLKLIVTHWICFQIEIELHNFPSLPSCPSQLPFLKSLPWLHSQFYSLFSLFIIVTFTHMYICLLLYIYMYMYVCTDIVKYNQLSLSLLLLVRILFQGWTLCIRHGTANLASFSGLVKSGTLQKNFLLQHCQSCIISYYNLNLILKPTDKWSSHLLSNGQYQRKTQLV